MTKRETWELIKQKHPDIEDFILQAAKIFDLENVEFIEVPRETKEDMKCDPNQI